MMQFILNQKNVSDYRQELKFVFSNMEHRSIIQKIKTNPAMFSEIFHSRWINNIYFDSPELNSYYHSIDGIVPRVKTRLRWYDHLFGRVKPILEFKLKQANKNTKVSFTLSAMDITAKMSLLYMKKAFMKNRSLPEEIKSIMNLVRPTLMNRYLRSYYRSEDKKFRITVDSDLSFTSLVTHASLVEPKKKFNNAIIVECKFEKDREEAIRIIQNFQSHFQLSRMSKYTIGLGEV